MLSKLKQIYINLTEKGFFHLLSVNLMLQFLSFGSSLFVSKYLSPVELGEIKIIQSYSNFFLLIASYGYATAILKFCSESIENEQKYGLFRHSLFQSIKTTGISIAILFIVAYWNIISPSPHINFWLAVYAAIIPFAVFTNQAVVLLQAIKKIKEMAKAQAIVKVQSVLCIILLTYYWGFKGFIFATIIAYIAGILPFFVQFPRSVFKKVEIQISPKYRNVVRYSFMANLVSFVSQNIDIVVLDHFIKDRELIGYYSLATIFILGGMQVTYTVQSIATPYFSEKSNDRIWFLSKLKGTSRKALILSIIVSLFIITSAYILVIFYYGEQYMPTLLVLSILLVRYVIWTYSSITGIALVGLGEMRFNFIMVGISTVVGIIMSFTLVKMYGIIGVATAQVLSALTTLLLVRYIGVPAVKKALPADLSGSN
ncbi:MAG: oligosaccharide flippase family protein [Desulfuromonadaceae bacterium]|nr:oligosaccharide flippase family protein [Desulfuromonadaceae bacterium]